LEFDDYYKKKEQLIEIFSSHKNVPRVDLAVMISPYRICPLGAHIDHQGGPVLGMTINSCTFMVFSKSRDSSVQLESRNYPGIVRFDLNEIAPLPGTFWGIYPRAAALALKETYELKRGLVGILDGLLPGCGLSSSASVLLAYLHGFAAVNKLELSQWDYVQLTRLAENKYIGLNNGILDQTSIVFGKKGRLLHIDTKQQDLDYLKDMQEERYRIIVAYSGYSRELSTSGYNTRVDECRMAASHLSKMAQTHEASLLSDVEENVFRMYGNQLEIPLRKRAQHYFTETRRVMDGINAWENGLIEHFGQLMNESCKSSIEQYECGVQPVCDLQQIVSNTDGVYGSRFMGGGFGGCVVGFVKPSRSAQAADEIVDSYRKLHPEIANQAAVYIARSDDGVRFI
jgi:galactokinase